ncbi:MAG: M48 family metallopeptidase [Haliscomenobacter sp.]|nr:M48 family metallopeptidase [Haliscomenobacter sp.]
MSTERLTVAGIDIDLIRKDIKNIHLAVYPPSGRVRIAAPEQMDAEAIRLFAISKIPWIRKHQRKFAEQQREAPREYVNGESHYFQGHRYLLHLIEHSGKNKVVVRNKKYLDLYVKPGATAAQREKALREWYRRELKKQIPPLVEKWQRILGVELMDWGVKSMRTKWGTCNPDARRIWLNLELAKKPIPCLEYIIVHEMVHLLERRHNARFVAYMDRFLPQWRNYKETLNGGVRGYVEWG